MSKEREEFVLTAIKALRDPTRSKGIHVRFSGFNDAFRSAFEGEDPRAFTEQLAREGKIGIRPCRGGVMLYLASEAPVGTSGGEAALERIRAFSGT